MWRRLYHHPERRFTYPAIGFLFGRDHSTVVNVINPVSKASNVRRCRERWQRIRTSAAREPSGLLGALAAMRVT
jgi:hypothetical protein